MKRKYTFLSSEDLHDFLIECVDNCLVRGWVHSETTVVVELARPGIKEIEKTAIYYGGVERDLGNTSKLKSGNESFIW